MIGILIQLAISWFLLWLFEKKDLSVLGFKPTKSRIHNFLFGFLAAATCFTIYFLVTTTLTKTNWSINKAFRINQFASSSWWTINSVIFEELIFRGALLYILIQKTGVLKACLISSIAFGIYHWFSFGVFGSPVQMIYVFFSTGLWGLMYSLSFAKTKSLYLPVGLHLGWNFLSIVIFSQGPLGQQFFINNNNGQLLSGIPALILTLFQIFSLPVIIYFYLKRYESKIRAEKK
jgi:uncharacterized protein